MDELFEKGSTVAQFRTNTNGPEGEWSVELKMCTENGKRYIVIYDPFAQRLMWFDNDRVGLFEAKQAFCRLVGLAMCDAYERTYADGQD